MKAMTAARAMNSMKAMKAMKAKKAMHAKGMMAMMTSGGLMVSDITNHKYGKFVSKKEAAAGRSNV